MTTLFETVVRRYLLAMEESDLDGVLRCFTMDGLVSSPVYGTMPVKPFYERLFADTVHVTLSEIAIYLNSHDPGKLIAHFGYAWERRQAEPVKTRLIDLFEFDRPEEKIRHLRIVFDGA